MAGYRDMNEIIEAQNRNAERTPCELAEENDRLKQQVAALCKERDLLKRQRDAAIRDIPHTCSNCGDVESVDSRGYVHCGRIERGEACKFRWRGLKEEIKGKRPIGNQSKND